MTQYEIKELARILAIEENYLNKMPNNKIQQERTKRIRERYLKAVRGHQNEVLY